MRNAAEVIRTMPSAKRVGPSVHCPAHCIAPSHRHRPCGGWHWALPCGAATRVDSAGTRTSRAQGGGNASVQARAEAERLTTSPQPKAPMCGRGHTLTKERERCSSYAGRNRAIAVQLFASRSLWKQLWPGESLACGRSADVAGLCPLCINFDS